MRYTENDKKKIALVNEWESKGLVKMNFIGFYEWTEEGIKQLNPQTELPAQDWTCVWFLADKVLGTGK